MPLRTLRDSPRGRREASDFANTQTLTQLSLADILVIAFLSGLGEARARRHQKPARSAASLPDDVPRRLAVFVTECNCVPSSAPCPCRTQQEWLFRGALLPAVGLNYTGAAISAAVFGALHVTGAL